MKYYLAGPMTGYPQFNFPAFDEAAAALRARGYDVVSPAELDSETSRTSAMKSEDGNPGEYQRDTGETWGDLLARDVKMIADDCGGIILMDKWWRSKGARLEAFVALQCGHKLMRYVPGKPLYDLGPRLVIESISQAIEATI
jgi:hypothetical protein